MKRINHDGPTLLGLSGPVAAPPVLKRPADAALIVDLRAPDAFARRHPATALNLAFGSKVGYWAGWVLPPDVPIALIAESERQATDRPVSCSGSASTLSLAG